jgi:hypothetical protein
MVAVQFTAHLPFIVPEIVASKIKRVAPSSDNSLVMLAGSICTFMPAGNVADRLTVASCSVVPVASTTTWTVVLEDLFTEIRRGACSPVRLTSPVLAGMVVVGITVVVGRTVVVGMVVVGITVVVGRTVVVGMVVVGA